MLRKLLLTFIFFLLIPTLVSAQAKPAKPTGFVNDYANVLSTEQRVALEEKLSAIKQSSGNEIAVVTVQSLDGDTIEHYAVELFEQWGIGEEAKDNGVLLLAAMQERKLRVEVGYGLEPVLTDLESYQIIEKIIKPEFKEGRYFDGLDKGVDAISSVLNSEGLNLPAETSEQEENFPFIFVIWFGLFLLSVLARVLGKSKSWWAGGVLGASAGAVVGLFAGFVMIGFVAMVILAALGTLFDYIVSQGRKWGSGSHHDHFPPWFGGFGGGGSSFGGGGFGGFGGGMSGGGGASGDW